MQTKYPNRNHSNVKKTWAEARRVQTRCICATTCTFGWQRCVVNSIYRWSGVLICHPPTISLRSDSDTIDHEKLLMNITDIDLTYNMKRKVITKISSSSLINCSGLLWRRHAGAHLDGHQHRTNKNICYRVLVQKRELIPLIIHSKYFPDSDWLKAYV